MRHTFASLRAHATVSVQGGAAGASKESTCLH